MKIIVEGIPVPLKRHRTSNNKMYDPSSKEKEYFFWNVKSKIPVHFITCTKPIRVNIQFYLPIPKSYSKKKQKSFINAPHFKKPDLSNLIKFVEDALNGFIWKDDNIIYTIIAEKYYSDKPRTVINVEEIRL